jgi:hypothetical protein
MGRSACIAAKRLGFGIGVFTVPKFAAAIFGRHGGVDPDQYDPAMVWPSHLTNTLAQMRRLTGNPHDDFSSAGPLKRIGLSRTGKHMLSHTYIRSPGWGGLSMPDCNRLNGWRRSTLIVIG